MTTHSSYDSLYFISITLVLLFVCVVMSHESWASLCVASSQGGLRVGCGAGLGVIYIEVWIFF